MLLGSHTLESDDSEWLMSPNRWDTDRPMTGTKSRSLSDESEFSMLFAWPIRGGGSLFRSGSLGCAQLVAYLVRVFHFVRMTIRVDHYVWDRLEP